jgi:hypothetical protein
MSISLRLRKVRTTFVSKPGNFAKKPMPEMLRLKIIGDGRQAGI